VRKKSQHAERCQIARPNDGVRCTIGGTPHGFTRSTYAGVGDAAPDCTDVPHIPIGSPEHKGVPRGGVDRRWPRSGLLFCHPTPDRKWYVISYYLGRQGDQSILSWDPPPVAAIRHLCGGEPGEDDTMYQTERIALGNGVTL
jgi:hypothetical protein